MRLLFIVMMFATCITGCPPVPQPVNPINDKNLPVCDSSVQPISENVCAGKFTASGLSCVNCPGASACYDAVDKMYCTNKGTCFDPLCASH